MGASIVRRWVRLGEITAIGIVFLFVILAVRCSSGQSIPASRPSPGAAIKRLYVDSFQGKSGSDQLRKSVTARLRADRRWQVVDRSDEADAVVGGSGETWVKGYYVINPRSKSWRQPVYGGYLSLEIKAKSGETLWSYLVTPGRMRWKSIDQDLADHIVRVMDAAMAEGGVASAGLATANSNRVSIAGAGSTFAAPLYQKWIESFEEQHSDVRTSYQAVGSERGIESLEKAEIDFAASDVPMTDQEMASAHLKIEQYPTVLGGVVAAYNLLGVGRDLRFTPEVLAEIYLGTITRWNDHRLQAVNPGARLPDTSIVVLHRSDGSGTSFAWTDFLAKSSPEWQRLVGTGMKVAWPTGEGAEGNEAVAAKVAQTPGTIGYMELTYALRHQLSFGLIKNPAGRFIQANLTTLGNAARSVTRVRNLRDSLIDVQGEDAYPIATFTWILIPESIDSTQKKSAIQNLVRWMLTAGQKESAGLGYLPLPKEIAETELRQLDSAQQ